MTNPEICTLLLGCCWALLVGFKIYAPASRTPKFRSKYRQIHFNKSCKKSLLFLECDSWLVFHVVSDSIPRQWCPMTINMEVQLTSWSCSNHQGVRTKYQIPETWDGRQPLIYPGSRENATATSTVEKLKVAPPAAPEKPKVNEAAESLFSEIFWCCWMLLLFDWSCQVLNSAIEAVCRKPSF